ncbi:MAG: class I SAM-dependent methyltransferase [Crocinitomicaceae bacterium]
MEQLEKKQCPICDSGNIHFHFHTNDYMITQEKFSVFKCDECGFLFTNPVPSVSSIGKYYESEVYVSHSNTKKGIKNFVYHLVRNFTLQRKIDLVQRYVPKGRLLDVGSGAGYFLNKAFSCGFDVTGLEPSEAVRMEAEQNFALDFRPIEQLYELPFKSIDVITLWHVLEHVYNLNEDVPQMLKLLKDDGVLIVAVPNPDSWDAKFYGEKWGGWDVPRHLYHFRKEDVSNLFQKYGAEIVEIKPMQFDPVYVSMLSEQYMGRNILYALWNGMRSYFHKNSHGCTSQIYVIKKKTDFKEF